MLVYRTVEVDQRQFVWDELDQSIIDKAIKQWRTGLRACVEVKGGHFAHKPVQNDCLQNV